MCKNMKKHYFNNFREKLHEGVVRDVERQQRRKMENTYVLQQQIDLTKQLKQMEKADKSDVNTKLEISAS